MKSPIKLIITTCLLLFIGLSTLTAQRRGAPSPEQMADRQTDKMVEKLNLSTEQTEQVKAINLKYATKLQAARKAAREKEDFNREEMMATRTAINEEKKEELKNILDEQQFAQLETIVEDSNGKRGKGRKGKKGRKS